jgi:hypothetical protein
MALLGTSLPLPAVLRLTIRGQGYGATAKVPAVAFTFGQSAWLLALGGFRLCDIDSRDDLLVRMALVIALHKLAESLK